MNDDNTAIIEKDSDCISVSRTRYDDALLKFNDIYYRLLVLNNYMCEYLLHRT
jgi:hypothetical protein